MNCIRLLRVVERKSYSSVFRTPWSRCVSNHPMRFMETQNMWKEKDGVSKRWQLIYKAPMGNILNIATAYLTFTTGVIGACSVYYGAFVFDIADLNNPIVLGDDTVIANNAVEGLIYLGAFMALHIAVKIVLSKYVVRLYQDGDEYLAVYRGHWYNTVSKHRFHLNDFKKLNPIMVIPWSESRYSLGSRQGILMENCFKTPEYFNNLLYKQNKDTQE